MTAEEIRVEIDNRLTALLGMIGEKQAQFKAQYGIYFQLLPTHSVVPADGAELAPDQATIKPDYQALSGADMGGLPEMAMSSTRIDTYQGAQGQGYVITSSVMLGGELWERSVNVGPEGWRVRAWEKVGE